MLDFMFNVQYSTTETKHGASSGNRTRATHVAGEHSTTEPTL